MDEPSSGLDYKNMSNMAKAIKYAASLGKTIFLITHDYELVNTCCTHYYNLSEENDYELQENIKKKLDEASAI